MIPFNNPNILNFISVFAFLFYYSSIDENDEHHTHNKSSILNKHHFFHESDFLFTLIRNDDLNFNEFIINCKAIHYASTFDGLEKKGNVEGSSYNNVDEFDAKCNSEKFQKSELPLSTQLIDYKTILMIRKIISKKIEHKRS